MKAKIISYNNNDDDLYSAVSTGYPTALFLKGIQQRFTIFKIN